MSSDTSLERRTSNFVPSLIVRDADSAGFDAPLSVTGRELTNAIPQDVSIVDSDGNQVLPSTSENQTNGSQKTQIVDGGGDVVDVVSANGYMGLVTVTPAHISTANSTSTPLAGGSTFTGTAEEVVNFGVIQVIVSASHASATDGFKIEYSTDGTNWDNGDNYTIGAGDSKVYSFQPAARYFRIVYTNGATLQTYFRLQTIVKPYYIKPSSHRIADLISPQDDAELVKSVLTAQKPNGDFTPIDATAGGNLKMSLQEISDGLDVGNGAVGSETQRVTIASDSTGRVFTYDHLPTEGNNPSTSITEAVVGTVTTTTIQKTIGATTYQQTIEEDSSDNSTTISAWSVV